MAQRNYSNVAPPIAMTVAATTTDTVLTVASTTGYPAAPFLLGLERGTANEEVVLCTSLTATAFTVTRGYDSTTAKAHAIGASVEHTVAAIDYREATGPRTLRIPHTFAVPGDILLPAGTDNVIPGFFVPVPAGQTAVLAGVYAVLGVGTANVQINRNGTSIYGPGGVTTTPTTPGAAGVPLTNLDVLSLVVSAIGGGAKNLTFTLFIDYTSVL